MILIDELIKENHPQSEVEVEIDGQLMRGWQIAKPLNYDPEYMSLAERSKMAKLIMEGKAIAVQFFSDLTEEQQVEYVKKKIEKQSKPKPDIKLNDNPNFGKLITE